MIIKRLRVEEGFFDGLDLEFDAGLNVLIGGRGVGKTSIIELIRFGLGVTGFTSSSNEDSISHALAVLQSGEVSIDLEVNGDAFTVSRSANDDNPRSPKSFVRPIVFSQKEIESVGSDSYGRLRLIDSFVAGNKELRAEISDIAVEIKSLSAAMVSIRKEIEEVSDKSSGLDEFKKIEKQLLKRQKEYASKNKSIKAVQEKLDALQGQISKYTVDQENLKELLNTLSDWQRYLKELVTMPQIPAISDEEANKSVQSVASELQADINLISQLADKSGLYKTRVQSLSSSLKAKSLPLEDASRGLRSQIESFQEGAGQTSRELGKVRESIARIENLNKIIGEKQKKLKALFSSCDEKVERMAMLQRTIFDQRKSVVEGLNERLGPTIQAEIQHLARLDAYESALKATLRGSGLKYNEIASIIASKISPQELLLLTHNSLFEEFAETLDIPSERAARLLGYLRDSDLGRILTADIEDDVQLMLLDGAGYKHINELSIGQRCTVTLSVVLENTNRVLLIDQPEDHLDNEFVAYTLIRAIRQRAEKAQSIISSHNANIPVLGEANRVVVLDSNGRRGFVKHVDVLDAEEIVNSIEMIMEGGKEAFSKRVEFYGA